MADDQNVRDRRFFAAAAVFGFAVFIGAVLTGQYRWFITPLALVCAIASTMFWWRSR